MSKERLPSLIGFGLVIDIIILDQISKWFVLEHIIKPHAETALPPPLGLFEWLTTITPRLPFTSVEIWPFFNFVMVWNQGISFGLFQSDTPWFLIGVALVITVFFSVWLWRSTSWIQAISLAMVIGGALGNVIDRFRFGAVADFLDFHAFGWHYPAFNVADSCITLGIAFLLIDGIFLEPKRNKGQTV